MRVSENSTDNTSLFIDECKPTLKNHHSSIQYPFSVQEHSMDNKSSECIYTEIVKPIRKNDYTEDNHSLRRASWSPFRQQECGLPPSGKRTDGAHSTINKTSNRVRMRPPIMKNSQPPLQQQISLVRPVSFNEKYDRLSIDRLSNPLLVRID